MEHLFKALLSGQATEEQKLQLYAWIDQNPENKEEFENYKLLWELSLEPKVPMSRPDFDNGLKKIWEKIEVRKRKKALRKQLTVLAIVVVTCFIVVLPFLVGPIKQGKNATLIFSNSKLNEVIDQIEKEFHVSIETNGSDFSRCRFTGIFYKVTSAEEAIINIAAATNLELKVHDPGMYTLSGQLCVN